MTKENSLVIFQNKQIRREWYKNKWYFSIVDVVEVLTDSVNATDYLKKLRKRDNILATYMGTNCPYVVMQDSNKKKRSLLAGSTTELLRIIQSIPSPKAEPFKLWLAQVGKERLDEIEDPELAQERMKSLYEKKGYPRDWIDKRLRGIAIRQGLTDEWKERGIKNKVDYAILTAEISKATFGMTPSQYKKLKKIPNRSKINLRDNMTDLELIFTMLGERVTTEISTNEKPSGFTQNKKVATRGGSVAGKARIETEKEIGKSIITGKNYLK
ncbi:MAG: BRO family protein [bacterium]|nr:MAG: BRO family protein [bacterium]